MASAWIRDGANVSSYIAEAPRQWGAVRLVHRPVTIEERAEIIEQTAPLKAAEQERKLAKFCAGKIVRWNLEDAKGDPLPVTDASLLKALHPNLCQRLQKVVLGYDAGDEDPEASAAEAEQRRQDQEAAADGKKPFGEAAEERREKNS